MVRPLANSGPDEMAKKQELQDLLQAEAHLAEADACIEKQRAIIEKLASDGHPTETAKQILATMLHSRHAFEEHRKAILETLEVYPVSARPPGSKGHS